LAPFVSETGAAFLLFTMYHDHRSVDDRSGAAEQIRVRNCDPRRRCTVH